MSTPKFRIGQVARLVSASVYHIRRLCECGLITGAEQTTGGWYIPAGEAERLKRELPPIPAPPAPDAKMQPKSPARNERRDGGQSQNHSSKEGMARLVDAPLVEVEPDELEVPEDISPQVQAELDGVQIEAARLQRRKIQLQAEEVEDSFRAREAARIADAQRVRTEQNRHLTEAARFEWRTRWLKYAQDQLPYGATPDVRLQVNDAVAAMLDNKLSVNDAQEVISRLVDAVVAISLKPYHCERRKREIIDKAIRALPPGLYHHLFYNDAAMDDTKRIARQAIEAVGTDATDAQLRTAASSALQPLTVEFQHNETKNRLIDGLRYWRWCVRNSPTDDERAAATEAVTNALDACPPGTPAATMEKIKDRTLALFDKRIEDRVSNERQKREAEREADRALLHVTTYVGKEYEFDSINERLEDEKRLEDALRPILIGKFLTGEFREASDAHRFIQQYIDQHIPKEER